MNEELNRFFKSISFSDDEFRDSILERVVLKKNENKFLVYIKNKDVLPVGSVNRLFLCAMNGINGEKLCDVNISYDNINNSDVIKYIDYLIDDLKRRDFTINTLCLDENGEYIDLLNARKDIDCKIIKTVGNSDKKIEDDILRSLRAIRFATILDFKLDEELKKSIMKYGYLLKNLSYYRKKDELDKIFSSPNAKYGIDLIKELKLQEYLELNNIDKLVITSPIAIWAQLDVLDKYNFSSSEREIIENVNEVMNLDLFDNNTLYKYGLYVCTLVAEIKGINRKEIILKYNNLQIKAPNEVTLKGMDICNLLNKKPGPYLKKIINTLEEKIVNNELLNNREDLSKYVLENY